MPKLRTKASALAVVSRTSTPRKATPEEWYWAATSDRVDASARHGTHQDPQKLSTTTLSR